jgi:exonuclease-1
MDGYIAELWLVLWNWQCASQPESRCALLGLYAPVLNISRFVEFSMHRVRMLQHFGVIPFLIFDGDYLPSKAATEADREKRREESRKAGQKLLSAGKTSQAYLEFQKAVDVTPEMARQLIDELKKNGVQYIVAPYEADAQMVYLERRGIIDGILSEDSDLLVFGAKCLLTKLDQYGNCIEINKSDFCACKEISLTGWSDVEFRCMAILSGCDYLNSITNMGLKTAYRMVRKHKTIEKIIRMLQFDGKFFVPKGYLEAFNQAELTFLHQRVFCPQKLTLVYHTEPELPIDDERMPFIGAYVEPEIAQAVARGDLNPITKLPIVPDSKFKMAVPITPWANTRLQPHRSNSTNDVKKGKPMDTFFKPKRVPLAELDINCFTPSPTQRETLFRNTGPWFASPAPRPYLSRVATDYQQLPQLPRSAPPAHSSTARTHIRTPTISEPRPPKRARLCADDESGHSSSKGQMIELGRSRFFTSAAPDPSPTVGRTLRGKKSKKQDINIFSDDSVDEVMRNLPDIEGFGVGDKIAVFDVDASKKSEDPDTKSSPIPQSARADGSQTSQDSATGFTPSMSRASSVEQPEPTTPVVATPRPPAIKKLKSAFSVASTGLSTAKSNPIVQALPTPSCALTRPSRIPLAVKPNDIARSTRTTSKPPVPTPLQRLGASAMSRPKLPMTPPLTPLSSSAFQNKRSQPRRSLLSKGSVPFPEVAQENKVKEVEPALIPLPQPDETENLALSMEMQNGSEDLIVHDSEEEECLSPVGDQEIRPINIGRFLFAG